MEDIFMMNYNEFKEIVTMNFLDYMPDKYQKMKLRVNSVNKINKTLDAITLHNDGKSRCISPTLYINDIYDVYVKTGDISAVLREAAETMDIAFGSIPTNINIDFNARENIIFQLINTEQNKKLLNDVPHREFLDLSIIYRMVIKIDEYGMRSAVISNDIVQEFGMDETELYNCAIENTKRILKPTVTSMYDMIVKRLKMPAEIADVVDPDNMMWVISSKYLFDGAGFIIYEDILHELAEMLGTDLYILPSSIHECLAVSTNMAEPYELEDMVKEVYLDGIELEERLSNKVYLYDRTLRKLTIAI